MVEILNLRVKDKSQPIAELTKNFSNNFTLFPSENTVYKEAHLRQFR